MFNVNLTKNTHVPLYEQLVAAIKTQIIQGKLRLGDILPPTRQLASQLSISRTTVCKAYDELYALGFIESHQGSYSKVRMPKTATSSEIKKAKTFDWSKRVTAKSQEIEDSLQHYYQQKNPTKIDFVAMEPDSNFMPVQDFRKALNTVLQQQQSSLLKYGSALGYLPLRKYLVEHLRQYGIAVTVDEILLTYGSQQSLDLICQMLLKPNDSVLLESPCYSLMIPMLKKYQAQMIDIPMKQDGLNISTLAQSLENHHASFLYTTPNFHNPTGISTNQAHREALFELCKEYQLPIIEDGFVDELRYFGKTALPIKAMDEDGQVIYLGSFSKILFPGIRVGWVVANKECIHHLSQLKLLSNLRGNQLNQAAMEVFCRHGFYDKHLKRTHAEYRRRMKLAINLANQLFPTQYFSFTTPNGGYTLFVSAKSTAINEQTLIENISNAGVLVSPGKNFYPQPSDYAHFRISIAEQNEQQITLGFEKIAKVLNQFCH